MPDTEKPVQATTPRAKAKAAAEAHTDLTVFDAVASILENGSIYTAAGRADAQRIIRICRAAQQKQLRAMDRHLEALDGKR